MRKQMFTIVICMLSFLLFAQSSSAASTVTVYVDDGNSDYLVETKVKGNKEIGDLLKCLVDANMLPDGTKVNDFTVGEENGETVGRLDLSKEYQDAVSQTGTAGETMYIYSVVNTVTDNFDLDGLYITVDGNVISTGHNIYDFKLTYYDHVIHKEELVESAVIENIDESTGALVPITPIEETTIEPTDRESELIENQESTYNEYKTINNSFIRNLFLLIGSITFLFSIVVVLRFVEKRKGYNKL